MWELDYKRSSALKNWCFWTVVLERDLASPLDSKKIQPVNPKGYQSWIFIGSTDAEDEAPVLWPPDMKDWLIGKDPDAGKDWSGRRRGRQGWDGWMTSWTQWTWIWVSSRSWWQGRLACCSPWDCKELDMTKQLNWTELNVNFPSIKHFPFELSVWNNSFLRLSGIVFVSGVKINLQVLYKFFLNS